MFRLSALLRVARPSQMFASSRVQPMRRLFSTEAPAPPAAGDDLAAVLAKKDEELKEFKTQRLLDLAEMENVRMRARRDVENERSFALTGASLCRECLHFCPLQSDVFD